MYQANLTERQCQLLAKAISQWTPADPDLEVAEVGSDQDEMGVLLEWFDEPQTHLVQLDDKQ